MTTIPGVLPSLGPSGVFCHLEITICICGHGLVLASSCVFVTVDSIALVQKLIAASFSLTWEMGEFFGVECFSDCLVLRLSSFPIPQ